MTLLPTFTMMQLVLTALALSFVISIIAVLTLRWALRTGKSLPIPIKGYTVRRWYCPGKCLSDEELLSLQLHMKDVCLNSVGCILAYPAFTARTAAELRREMQNKIIMLVRLSSAQLSYISKKLAAFAQ
jgi:hypothetical protein